MKIPSEFQLQDHIIKVTIVDSLKDDDDNELLGESDSERNTIKLCSKVTRKGRRVRVPKSQMNHTLLHELMHQILDKLGEEKISNNEKVVDGIAGMLLQFLNTKR